MCMASGVPHMGALGYTSGLVVIRRPLGEWKANEWKDLRVFLSPFSRTMSDKCMGATIVEWI